MADSTDSAAMGNHSTAEFRITQRHDHDGSSVTYYALAESVWSDDAKRREAHVVRSFGRADQLDRAELERLVKSINRVLEDGDGAAGRAAASDRPEICLL